jgi:hypothetical protein
VKSKDLELEKELKSSKRQQKREHIEKLCPLRLFKKIE